MMLYPKNSGSIGPPKATELQHSPSAAGLPSMAASVSVEDMVTDCLIFFTVLSAAKSELLLVRFIFSEDDRKIF